MQQRGIISGWVYLKQSVLKTSRVLLTASGVASCVIMLRLAGVWQPSELGSLDLLFNLRPIEPIDRRVVVIGIDEADLRRVGKWPIPDRVMGRLLTKLQSYQPRVIGLDIYRDLPVEPGHAELLRLYRTFPNLVGIEQIKDQTNVGIPAPSVLAEREQIGFNNLVSDVDGKVRRSLLYWHVDGKTHQSFALTIALAYLKREGITPQASTRDSRYLQLGKASFRQFEPNDGAYVRADDGGYQILANLRGGTGTFATVSLTDFLAGRVQPELLRDRIVIIGSTAISLRDFFQTSYSNSLLGSSPQPITGVELQANFVSQILSEALQGRVALNVWSEPLEWLWILFWAWVGARVCWSLRSPPQAAFTLLLASISLSGLCALAFLLGWWLPLVPSMAAMGGAAIVILAHIAHLQEELKRSKEFLSTIINTIPDPVFVKDKQHRWVVLNQAYARFLDCPLDDLLEKSDADVFSPAEAEIFRQQDQLVFRSEQEQEHEENFTDKRGVTHQIATKRSLHKDAAGNVFLVGVIRDITERKRAEEELKRAAAELMRSNAELEQSASQLRHLANHDVLTGLPNRKLFYERLGQSIDWAKDNKQAVGLLFLDLDGFKLINDTQGHDVGDLLLKAAAKRLTGCLRSSDTVSRLGGDEFTVILPAIPSSEDAARVAEKILTTLASPFQIEQHTIFVSASIGISLYPQNGETVNALTKAADGAMYSAKELGKNRCEFASLDATAQD
ncbi:MAG: CHASE2 domain-containing protein [Stenomitos rutilans HA7619-LM2]|jgi:diguanylate cyclase (GGDEF)-like protein/PAS domain S-box-containing protein|nr:CHASE2 domain-containing protein [Stenomitos rutilans HA7619-LM2]